MAAYVNRTLSLMPGEGPSGRGGALVSNGDSRVSNSPLQIFVKAKKKINDIFVEVEDYVKDTVQYMQGMFYFKILQFIFFSFYKIGRDE